MSVSATTSTHTSYLESTSTSNTSSNSNPSSSLGADDFLKLLSVQFQSQDPMNPMEDTAFIAQMAQFTSLEQTSAMSSKITELLEGQALSTANSYIGREVTLSDDGETYVQGTVEGVEVTDEGPRLIIGDYTYSLSSVVAVEPATTTATTTSTDSTSS